MTDGYGSRNYFLWRSKCICTFGVIGTGLWTIPRRRTARRVLLPERCNKFCIGLGQWKLLGKFRPVSCTMNVDKS
jgi:hypothetical protein